MASEPLMVDLSPQDALFRELIEAHNNPDQRDARACRLLNPECRVCAHPGNAEGTLGCIAFLLALIYQKLPSPIIAFPVLPSSTSSDPGEPR